MFSGAEISPECSFRDAAQRTGTQGTNVPALCLNHPGVRVASVTFKTPPTSIQTIQVLLNLPPTSTVDVWEFMTFRRAFPVVCPWVVEVFVEMKWYFQGRELKQDDLLKRHPPLTTTQMSDIRVLIIKHSAAGWISRTWFNHESFNSQGWICSYQCLFRFCHREQQNSAFYIWLVQHHISHLMFRVLSDPVLMVLFSTHFRLIWSNSFIQWYSVCYNQEGLWARCRILEPDPQQCDNFTLINHVSITT